MRCICIVVATIALTITTPVIADPSFKSYYLVQDNETKTCKVVDVKPTPNGVPTLVYESRALAEAAIAEASAYEYFDCSITGSSADSITGSSTTIAHK
jgi:NaMN:DMB phosphoribosyltransferase